MMRTQVRAVARPDVRRTLVLGFAIAATSLVLSAVAGAQEQSASASVMVQPAEHAQLLLQPATSVRGMETTHERGTTSAAPMGPMMASSAMSYSPAVTRQTETPMDERRQDNRVGLGRNLALVVVGVAAIIIGSEVDGAGGGLLVAGGAGMSLYGLYHILR